MTVPLLAALATRVGAALGACRPEDASAAAWLAAVVLWPAWFLLVPLRALAGRGRPDEGVGDEGVSPGGTSLLRPVRFALVLASIPGLALLAAAGATLADVLLQPAGRPSILAWLVDRDPYLLHLLGIGVALACLATFSAAVLAGALLPHGRGAFPLAAFLVLALLLPAWAALRLAPREVSAWFAPGTPVLGSLLFLAAAAFVDPGPRHRRRTGLVLAAVGILLAAWLVQGPRASRRVLRRLAPPPAVSRFPLEVGPVAVLPARRPSVHGAWIVDPRTGKRSRYVDALTWARAFRPDGGRLALLRWRRAESSFVLEVADGRTGEPLRSIPLRPRQRYDDWHPPGLAWVGDLVVVASDEGSGSDPPSCLWVVDPGTGRVRHLAESAAGIHVLGTPGGTLVRVATVSPLAPPGQLRARRRPRNGDPVATDAGGEADVDERPRRPAALVYDIDVAAGTGIAAPVAELEQGPPCRGREWDWAAVVSPSGRYVLGGRSEALVRELVGGAVRLASPPDGELRPMAWLAGDRALFLRFPRGARGRGVLDPTGLATWSPARGLLDLSCPLPPGANGLLVDRGTGRIAVSIQDAGRSEILLPDPDGGPTRRIQVPRWRASAWAAEGVLLLVESPDRMWLLDVDQPGGRPVPVAP